MKEQAKFAVGRDETVNRLTALARASAADNCAQAITTYRDENYGAGQPFAAATAYAALTEAIRLCRDIAARDKSEPEGGP